MLFRVIAADNRYITEPVFSILLCVNFIKTIRIRYKLIPVFLLLEIVILNSFRLFICFGVLLIFTGYIIKLCGTSLFCPSTPSFVPRIVPARYS